MDNVKSIAIGVMTRGYWPPHLGLKTDAEKIEWLCRQVERLSDELDEAYEVSAEEREAA